MVGIFLVYIEFPKKKSFEEKFKAKIYFLYSFKVIALKIYLQIWGTGTFTLPVNTCSQKSKKSIFKV